MSSSPVEPEEARRTARDILSGAEYSEPQESLVERAAGWLFDRLGDAVATLTGGGPGTVIGWLVVAALGAAAAWLLVRSLRAPSVGSAPDGDSLRYGTEAAPDPDAWSTEEERLAAAGDHRGALRCRYQALLARLIAGGVVDDVRGRTSGEYRALLTERLPVEAGHVDEVTRRFEDAWYGGGPVTAADHARFTEECRWIETAAEGSMVEA